MRRRFAAVLGIGWEFDWHFSPGEGEIWTFLHPTWHIEDISVTAILEEREYDPSYVSRLRMRRTVRKSKKQFWKTLKTKFYLMLFTKEPNTTFLYVIHGSGQGQYNVIDIL